MNHWTIFKVAAAGLALTATLQAAPSSSTPAKLKQLPPVAQQVYAETPPAVKQLLCEEIKGQTTLVPGVLVVNHKTAFIRGRAVGKNVFDFMREHVDDMIAEGKMSPDFGPHVHRFFEAARGLSAEQRATLVDILNNESTP